MKTPIYIGVWSFSGISSRIHPLAHDVVHHRYFTLKQLRLPVLNEMHTNSCTGPRLLWFNVRNVDIFGDRQYDKKLSTTYCSLSISENVLRQTVIFFRSTEAKR